MVKKEELMAALKKLNGCSIGSIDTLTEVELTGGKANPQKGRITKRMIGGNVMFFCNIASNAYQNMVKRRLEQEGKNPETFTLSARKWGERVPTTPFVMHKGEIYLEAIFIKSPKKVEYFLDGQPIEKENIIGLKSSGESEQGGLDNKVVIRTYKLSSIEKVKMGDMSVGC